jgi:transcriptional regulator with XRE-family HTH domain
MQRKPAAPGIGTRLREAREASGLKYEVVLARAGISRALLSHYELGKHEPTATKLGTIARTLGVTTDWLIYG